jgi:hypothetical protein
MTMRLHDTNTSTCVGAVIMQSASGGLKVVGPFDSPEQLAECLKDEQDIWWQVSIEDIRTSGHAEIYVVGAAVKENSPKR